VHVVATPLDDRTTLDRNVSRREPAISRPVRHSIARLAQRVYVEERAQLIQIALRVDIAAAEEVVELVRIFVQVVELEGAAPASRTTTCSTTTRW